MSDIILWNVLIWTFKILVGLMAFGCFIAVCALVEFAFELISKRNLGRD
jgi:hypothetical protein